MTVIGALSGNPLGALLPVLANSLASERHKARVEAILLAIDVTLRDHSEALKDLSDAQYQLLNESILALFQTTSEGKLQCLRNAVQNTLYASNLHPQEVVVLGRVIRDISADEAAFLAKNFQYWRVQLQLSSDETTDSRVLSIPSDSPESLIVAGLISLGLLSTPGPAAMDIGRFAFTPIVAKLLVLLDAPRP